MSYISPTPGGSPTPSSPVPSYTPFSFLANGAVSGGPGDMPTPGCPQASIDLPYIAPCDGDIKRITLSSRLLSAGGNVTVYIDINGVNQFTGAAGADNKAYVFTLVAIPILQGDKISCRVSVSGTCTDILIQAHLTPTV